MPGNTLLGKRSIFNELSLFARVKEFGSWIEQLLVGTTVPFGDWLEQRVQESVPHQIFQEKSE